jgi:glycosyltransferase involved in cell wall biosynthesis
MAHKGVLTLVDGFARIAAEDPRVSLTLVGTGPLADTLDRRIAGLGLSGRVTRRPAVPPDQVTALMHEHDLLVHASRLETFGMTVVEAVATGTPVLVARSQGPAETLAGIEHQAGLLIEPGDDPDVIADGYRRLCKELDTLDLPRARATLAARYGFAAVASRLREVYHPGTAAPAPPTVAEERPAGNRHRLSRLVRFSAVTVPDRILCGVQRVTAVLPAPGPEAVVRYLRRIPAAVGDRILPR